MTFDLTTILILVLCGAAYAAFLPSKGREWALLVGSVVALYVLQPAVSLRFAGYLFPTFTLLLTLLVWWLTRPAGAKPTVNDGYTAGVIAILLCLLTLWRYVPLPYQLLANRPPAGQWVLLGCVVVGSLSWLIMRRGASGASAGVTTAGFVGVATLFVLLKTAPLAAGLSWLGRSLTGQDTSLASALDLNWLGFSYVAFRLLHTLRDHQTGQLPELNLRQFVTYVIFTPAVTAGPIHRAENFAADWQKLPELVGLDPGRWGEALFRIAQGVFKKFVVADMLAQGLALTPALAEQSEAAGWLWLLLYGYALRLFFDFSGYTDIAIGLGLLFGLRLPENFSAPYLKTNLTHFWQSWHMSLSDWARFYVFSPLSRTLLRRKPRPSPTLIVLLCQLATMLVVGLWHGVTINFVVWGLWHGVGLFLHKQWSDVTRPWYRQAQEWWVTRWVWQGVAWFITFHYVCLGWVWFVVPEVAPAGQLLWRLLGGY